MIMPSRLFHVLLIPAMLLSLAGCGYSTRPLYNSAYHTISVPVFGNKSFRRGWEERLTEALKKNIESRTPYKVVSQDKADTILSGEIVDDPKITLTRRSGILLPRESQFTVLVNFTWKTRTGTVLVDRKDFNRAATEIQQLGEREEDAEQWAIERLAAAMVDQMQSDW
jgi:hypothetical protein